MAQKARSIMTPTPVTLPSQATLADAAKRMRDCNIGDVLVVDDGRLRGIVTDRDIVVRGIAADQDPHQTQLSEVCSREMVCCSPEDDAEHVVEVMRERAVRRIPLVEHGRLVGIVSLGDVAVERDSHSALADISGALPNI
ncbi:CBS domain-containing protein [Nonomuraea sp. SYSU D8015]|uniref:CBS domain-containing protein n=1 Tax=Nonomuraea sp. SYSU D8015 TaxID=2593644 RepID=UPI0016601A98|nr:CBS domain-containing protein [Nonomuraea sp. SYSU D8015]